MRIVTIIRYSLIIILLMVMSMLMMNFIHESVHVLQFGGEISQVCYLGYWSKYPNYAGWTIGLYEAKTNEITPIIISLIITLPTVMGLGYFLFGGIKD